MGHCVICDVSYLLKGMSKLFTSHVDSFDESFIADELPFTDTMAGLILPDFDKELVTVNCCWLYPKFDLLAISFLIKVVSDPQSKSAFISTEIGPFDNIIGMICKKVWLFLISVYTVASESFGGLDASVLWLSVARW